MPVNDPVSTVILSESTPILLMWLNTLVTFKRVVHKILIALYKNKLKTPMRSAIASVKMPIALMHSTTTPLSFFIYVVAEKPCGVYIRIFYLHDFLVMLILMNQP